MRRFVGAASIVIGTGHLLLGPFLLRGRFADMGTRWPDGDGHA